MPRSSRTTATSYSPEEYMRIVEDKVEQAYNLRDRKMREAEGKISQATVQYENYERRAGGFLGRSFR
ncbi:hypothetical protein FBEOM_728 [Fusarium beomiforme]|uniref:Uncharacterized protein n=1 Tax=Fusarium beomiforme TaxID=44412 RepID=A0A9P5AV51_9HYPO|nr:hypothetical protein FBEOM_728 [Fusarium beomiforme]